MLVFTFCFRQEYHFQGKFGLKSCQSNAVSLKNLTLFSMDQVGLTELLFG